MLTALPATLLATLLPTLPLLTLLTALLSALSARLPLLTALGLQLLQLLTQALDVGQRLLHGLVILPLSGLAVLVRPLPSIAAPVSTGPATRSGPA